jgi:hypothetical protein
MAKALESSKPGETKEDAKDRVLARLKSLGIEARSEGKAGGRIKLFLRSGHFREYVGELIRIETGELVIGSEGDVAYIAFENIDSLRKARFTDKPVDAFKDAA